ncbi:hypothetical protein SAMN06297251_11143 [Fulvimarina manganoxydans]|uniref:Uncharacterized protein n=1 Tax=Fulvimarina manganoxydans TaxID=937218 RepID=A0A1W2CR89_9HYPH|nr:hypothetical protein SAMN06297251_11143 [Fulvimarina manganoxydans]
MEGGWWSSARFGSCSKTVEMGNGRMQDDTEPDSKIFILTWMAIAVLLALFWYGAGRTLYSAIEPAFY